MRRIKVRVSKKRVAIWILAGIVLVLFCATVAGLIYYRKMIKDLGVVQNEEFKEFSRIYAYIAEDPDSKLTKKIYKEISEYAVENDCYVELTGQNLSTSYSKADRFNMAISSKVDGIIVEGDDSKEIKDLIDKAAGEGIPVVTVLSDCLGSSRKSFVALDNFRLGTEYGEKLIELASNDPYGSVLDCLILIDSDEKNYDDVIHTAIKEEVNGKNVDTVSQVVDISTPFTAQEGVAGILDRYVDLPDVIVCLNDRTSDSVYEYIVERNLVGQVTVLAYFDSDTIVKAIVKGSVKLTYATDAKFVAEQCVKALNEYNDTGFVSEYFQSNYILIDRNNVSNHMPEDKDV